MWPYLVPFLLALLAKLYKNESFRTATTIHEDDRVHNVVWTLRFIFMFAIMYMYENTESAKWKWAMFCAHCLAGSANMFITVFRTPDFGSLHSAILIGAGCIFGRVFMPDSTRFISITALIAFISTVEHRRDCFMYSMAAGLAYIFFIGTQQLPAPFEIFTLGLAALVRCIALVEWECTTTPMPILLAVYNVLYILNIPMENPDALTDDDILLILGLGFIVFTLQWIVGIWVQEIGAASYALGVVLYETMLIMAQDISTEMAIIAWITLIFGAYTYSTFPSSQSPPHPEPSVPPLPPGSPKKKHDDSKPSAPLDLPDPPSEAPVQGEIV